MRHFAFASIIVLGCSSAVDEPPNTQSATAIPSTAAPSASATPNASVVPSAAAEPTQIDIAEGAPKTLPDGTIIAVGKILYAHLKDSKNLSMCEVTVTHDGKVETKTLRREGSVTFETIAGLRIALDGVDPYHQPSTAVLLIEH